jgi:hypothetical protein
MSVSNQLSPAFVSSPERDRGGIRAFSYIIFSSFVLLIHVAAVAYFGLPAFAWVFAVTIASLFISFEFAFAFLIVNLLIQNLFVSLISPLLRDTDRFTALLATNFLVVLLMAAFGILFWFKLRPKLSPDRRQLLVWLVFFFGVLCVYTPLGIAHSSLTSALIYARVYLIGGLLLIAGIAIGYHLNFRYVVSVIRLMAIFLVAWGVIEFLFVHWLYELVNVVDYMHFKFAGGKDVESFGTLNDIIASGSSSYLNLSGDYGLDLSFMRLKGPNLHPISYAYALAFCALICFIYRYYVLLLGCIVMMLLVGAKGPLLMVFVALAAYPFYSKRNHSPRWFLLALGGLLVAYVIIVFSYGLATEDYHVVGLMGGLRGFVQNPLGRGVGVGGNMSDLAATQTNFAFFQENGADFALESAFGVMLYQIGIFTAVFLLYYRQILIRVWAALRYFANEPRLIVIPVALAVLFVNGIFQEEALSPAGWGLWLLMSGLLIARHWRADPSVFEEQKNSLPAR